MTTNDTGSDTPTGGWVRSEIVFATPRPSGRTINLIKRVVSIDAPRRLTDPAIHMALVPGSLTVAEAASLASYLESATALVLAPGTVPDRLTGRLLCRLGVMTDGEWVWGLQWADYVRAYRVAPPEGLRDHVRRHDYVPREVSESRVDEIVDAVPGLVHPGTGRAE